MKRVVITGMGVISPIGTGLDSFWNGLASGKNGISKITHFDASRFSSRIAGEVKDFKPEDYFDKKEARRLVRFIQFAVAASQIAAKDADLTITPENAPDTGVLIGSGIGGIAFLEEQAKVLLEKGPEKISPFTDP